MAALAETDRTIWSAVGILSFGYDLSVDDALLSILLSAFYLGVDPVEVAEYVEWRGATPT